jgi:hypothetical protein
MRALSAVAIAAICSLGGTALAGGAALADGIAVRLLNDTPNNLIVTLKDLNAQPPQYVASGEVINGNAAINLSITADASGFGHLAWTATTVDRDMRRCGHLDIRRVKAGATIHVFANHRCSGH